MIDQGKIERFNSRDYRVSYMSGRVRTSIAMQIRQLRENTDISQSDLANRVGTRQSAISRLENTEYGRASVQTLLDIANALDVALVIKFVSYDDFISQHGSMTPDSLSAETFCQTYERHVTTKKTFQISAGLRLKMATSSDGNVASGIASSTRLQERRATRVFGRGPLVAAGSEETHRPDPPLANKLMGNTAQPCWGIRAEFEGEKAA